MKNYVLFKNPYVLIEDTKGKFQPLYKEYSKHIPSLYLRSPTLCSPFSKARRVVVPKKKPGNQAGYCEICYCKFENYKTHIFIKDHLEYAKRENNYAQIDAFINEINKENKINECIIPNSPCDKLAAEFFGNRNEGSEDTSFTESTIKLSWISSVDIEMKPLNIVLNKIEKNNLKDE